MGLHFIYKWYNSANPLKVLLLQFQSFNAVLCKANGIMPEKFINRIVADYTALPSLRFFLSPAAHR